MCILRREFLPGSLIGLHENWLKIEQDGQLENIPHSFIDFSKAQVFIVVDIERSPDFIPSCCLLWGREVG